MVSTRFDRIVAALAEVGPRRDTVKAAVAAGIAMAASRLGASDPAAKKHKKRCRKIGERCGDKHKCCNTSGLVACQSFPSSLCVGVEETGKRCCGQEGAKCDPNFGDPVEPPQDSPNAVGNCSCCEPLYCGKQISGEFRCQTEDT